MDTQPSPSKTQIKIQYTIARKWTLRIMGVFIIFGMLLIAMPVFAHPGNTASDGCHYCRTNCSSWGYTYGTRHCHGGSSYSVPSYTSPTYSAPTYNVPSYNSPSTYSSILRPYKYGDKYYSTLATPDAGLARTWEGKTILDVYTSEWYLVKDYKKHWIPDWETAEIWGLLHKDATGFTNYDIQRIESGEQLKFWAAPFFINNREFFNKWEGKTILDVTNGKMYLVKNHLKHHIPDFLSMLAWGLIYEDATGFSQDNLNKIPTGENYYQYKGPYSSVVEAYRDTQFADVSDQIPYRLYEYIQDNYSRIKR